MGAFLSLAHQVLELGKELLDGIEIGTVRRQEEEMGAGVADRVAGGFAFVRTEIVEDDDVARRQGRRQKLFDISVNSVRLIGPSRTQGASTRSQRKAAMKV